LDAEVLKYVGEAYPKGVCSVYSTKGKDVEGPGSDSELAVVIQAARNSPQNFWLVKLIINYQVTMSLSLVLQIHLNRKWWNNALCSSVFNQ